MSGLNVIIILCCVIALLYFTKIGKRLCLRASGTADEIITKDASTPEGAKAYYNAAIAKKEDDFQKSNTLYAQMLGKIEGYEQQLRTLKKENMQLDLKVASCVNDGNDDGAKVCLSKQHDITEKIEIIKIALKELKDNSLVQKELVDNLLDEIAQLKSEKDTAILTLETAQTTKSLQATSGLTSREEDKMLEKVRDGIKKTKEEVDGSKIVYESSVSVQQKRLDKKIRDDEIQKKLEELKAAKKK